MRRCIRCSGSMAEEPPDETDRQPGVRCVLLCLSCGNRLLVGGAPLAELPRTGISDARFGRRRKS